MFEKSITLNENFFLAKSNLAMVECTEGNMRRSRELYEEAVSGAVESKDVNGMWLVFFQKQTGTVQYVTVTVTVTMI